MTLADFLAALQDQDKINNIQFTDTISIIDHYYNFTPCAFRNGAQHNAAGQNNGSCKILAFALLHNLSAEQTLHCFGDYYRIDVLQHPEAEDHQNIRNLIKQGWEAVHFEGQALAAKQV